VTTEERTEVGGGRPDTELPLLLADLHRSLPVDDVVELVLVPRVRAPGWSADRATDLVVGAGFALVEPPVVDGARIAVRATRIRSLPDTVGADMRLLVVGLNPSPTSADSGIGYARPGNRFWPAVLEAGVASVDRDPRHALAHHGLGMTDLVRRTTVRADEVDRGEYRTGAARVERLVAWLRPRAVCFVGLGGWRTVVDRRAVAGVQPGDFGGRPAYLMPHTSGLNARSRLSELSGHLRAAARLADEFAF